MGSVLGTSEVGAMGEKRIAGGRLVDQGDKIARINVRILHKVIR
jgi:hypothetical protein